MRRVVTGALLLVAAGSGLTVFITAPWQLVLTAGACSSALGTGSMALALVATIVGRWFVARRGLVSGILTAASATGQLVFLPLIATLADRVGWRAAALAVSAAALLWCRSCAMLRDRPADLGLLPLGGTARRRAAAQHAPARPGWPSARCSARPAAGSSGCSPAVS